MYISENLFFCIFVILVMKKILLSLQLQPLSGKLCLEEIVKAFKKMGIVITKDEAKKLSKR